MVTNNKAYVQKQAAVWMEQATVAWSYLEKTGQVSHEQFWGPSNPYLKKISELFENDFAVARLIDSSDLVIHAEGPGAIHHSPSLGAVNWLCSRMERRLRTLVESVLPMNERQARAVSRDLDLRLTGLAAGSLYLGFSVAPPQPRLGFEAADEQAMSLVRDAVESLPLVPQFVTDTDVSPEIANALPDPALRDAAIVAAHDLAPTGRKGIHTVEINAPRSHAAGSVLGQRERVVLRDNMRSPLIGKRYRGSFVGDLRALDLDTGRASLRHVADDINSIRCVFAKNITLAQKMYGRTVRVTGEYEAGKDGKPRLMKVFEIQEANLDLNANDD